MKLLEAIKAEIENCEAFFRIGDEITSFNGEQLIKALSLVEQLGESIRQKQNIVTEKARVGGFEGTAFEFSPYLRGKLEAYEQILNMEVKDVE